jgi:hypothetical protein
MLYIRVSEEDIHDTSYQSVGMTFAVSVFIPDICIGIPEPRTFFEPARRYQALQEKYALQIPICVAVTEAEE